MRADQEPAEYVSLGPIFATHSKLRPDPIVGVEELSRIRAKTSKPLVAIGGITFQNALDVLSAKADSLAIISGIVPETASRKSIRRRAEEWLAWLA